MSMRKGRNLWLDLMKLVLCWMIISIHFTWETYDYHPVYRLAVPMFFAISGYFNYRIDASSRQSGAMTFIKRSLKYMVFGFAFYIVFDFILCYVDDKGVGYYFTTLFYEDFWFDFVFLNRPITYSGAQLWFLIALFIVSLVHYLLVRFKKEHYYFWIVPVTLAVQIFFGGYMRLFQYTDMPIRYTRNAWFMGLPFFGMGYLLAQFDLHKKQWYKYIYLCLGMLFFLLQIREHDLVETEVYASTIPATAFLLLFFLGLPSPKADFYYNWVGKDASFWIYILHMAAGIVVGRIYEFEDLLLRSIVIWVMCLAVYEIGFLFMKLLRKIRSKAVILT